MSKLPDTLNNLLASFTGDLEQLEAATETALIDSGYTVVEKSVGKPWGMYLRLDNNEADEFITDFFSNLTPQQARLGVVEAELSPKILIVSPSQRLSLQTHARRAERWRFLTSGYFYKSTDNSGGDKQHAEAGQVVQFECGETHRLCGYDEGFVMVAEIWQHTDPTELSNEADITRLADDYSR